MLQIKHKDVPDWVNGEGPGRRHDQGETRPHLSGSLGVSNLQNGGSADNACCFLSCCTLGMLHFLVLRKLGWVHGSLDPRGFHCFAHLVFRVPGAGTEQTGQSFSTGDHCCPRNKTHQCIDETFRGDGGGLLFILNAVFPWQLGAWLWS